MKVSLPANWAEAKISEIAFVNKREKADHLSDETKVSFIPMKDVEEESGKYSYKIREMGEVKKGYTQFFDGDLLFAKITPCMENGKAAVVDKLSNGIGFGSTEFHVIRTLSNDISPHYLFYFLIQKNYRLSAERHMAGAVGQRRVSKKYIEDTIVPIPPAAEQERILNKFEELFSKLDKGVEALERAQALLRRYRASVLKAAVEGRLVPTEADLARQENRDYEPADKLLERILDERRAAWEGAELAKMIRKGQTPKNDKWKNKYKESAAPDTSDLPELPEGWVWVTLEMLADIKGGITKDKKRKIKNGRSVPYLRVANVQRGFLDLSEMKTIEAEEKVIDELRLIPGDVLFTEGGDRDKLGRGWVWSGEVGECIHQNHIFRARLFLDSLSGEYISWFGNSFGQEYFMRQGKQTTNLASINLTKLRGFPVALPPQAEQARIEEELDRMLTSISVMDKLISAELNKSNALRQSILKNAFQGNLVPQDPNDEPATTLLESIKAERTKTNPSKPRGKNTK